MKPARRRSALLLTALLALVAAGCGGDDATTQPDPIPPGGITPGNDTALNTIRRFEHAYEAEALAEYVALFTADFHYDFSLQADPNLVSQYGTTWGVLRDSASTRHLFEGFTNDGGQFVPGADSIALYLGFGVAPNHWDPDSLAYYAMADVPSSRLEIFRTGDVVHDVEAAYRIWLVRGDAAWLRPGQPADASHWYIQRWEDLSVPVFQGPTSTTWGRLKAQYE